LSVPRNSLLRSVFADLGVATIAAAPILHVCPADARTQHPWLASNPVAARRLADLPPPPGFARVPAAAGSFASWLRELPLKPTGTKVHLYDGRDKNRQDVQAAVIDIDTGRRDLQQCADAVMRLRAEWLFASGRRSEIGFNFTGGGHVAYSRYAAGDRPDASGRHWRRRAVGPDHSYAGFRRYLNLVFAYAGTASLSAELLPIPRDDIAIGDVFIKGGFPGHAVLIADLAENPTSKEKRVLLVQSYMPAQDMHVLKNPANADDSPWYAIPKEADPLVTPEWTFPPQSLRRWP
jgi:hypothetical protein